MSFTEKVEKWYRDCVDLMFFYGNEWICHLDDIFTSVDVENAGREKYGLWNSCIDINVHLKKFGLD